MPKGIQKRLRIARSRVQAEITAFASQGGKYARGLAGEGYLGGYMDCIDDVLLALRGIRPPNRGRFLWDIEDHK